MNIEKLSKLNSEELIAVSGGKAAIQYPQKQSMGTGSPNREAVPPSGLEIRRSSGFKAGDVKSLVNDVAL